MLHFICWIRAHTELNIQVVCMIYSHCRAVLGQIGIVSPLHCSAGALGPIAICLLIHSLPVSHMRIH